jgi:hypothetical protein
MRRCAASWSAASGNSSLKAANWATSTLVSQETSRIQVKDNVVCIVIKQDALVHARAFDSARPAQGFQDR